MHFSLMTNSITENIRNKNNRSKRRNDYRAFNLNLYIFVKLRKKVIVKKFVHCNIYTT